MQISLKISAANTAALLRSFGTTVHFYRKGIGSSTIRFWCADLLFPDPINSSWENPIRFMKHIWSSKYPLAPCLVNEAELFPFPFSDQTVLCLRSFPEITRYKVKHNFLPLLSQ